MSARIASHQVRREWASEFIITGKYFEVREASRALCGSILREIVVIHRGGFYSPRVVARQREESHMTFKPEEWRKLSERQRQTIIRKIEREEKRAKTVIVVMVFILVFALLLSLFAVMSSCPTPQDATPKGQENETQAQHKPSRGISPEPPVFL